MTQRETIVMFRDQLEAIAMLTSLKDVKVIVMAIIEYGMNGKDVDVPEHLQFGWMMIKKRLDISKERYQEVSDRNRMNALARWGKTDATRCDRMQSHTTACDTMPQHATRCHNDNENVNENENECANAHNSAPAPAIEKYPATVDEVLKIAQEHLIACTRKIAEDYFLHRDSRDWLDAAGRKILPKKVPADLKMWVMREDEKTRKEKHDGRYFAEGKHISETTDYRTDPL